MKNLDQIRAANALEAAKTPFAAKNNGEVVKKLPARIQTNGLLGAAAFAYADVNSKGEAGGHKNAFLALLKHLSDSQIDKCKAKDIDAFFKEMCGEPGKPGKGSSELRAATSEALAYLSFLRRFAKKGKEEVEDEN